MEEEGKERSGGIIQIYYRSSERNRIRSSLSFSNFHVTFIWNIFIVKVQLAHSRENVSSIPIPTSSLVCPSIDSFSRLNRFQAEFQSQPIFLQVIVLDTHFSTTTHRLFHHDYRPRFIFRGDGRGQSLTSVIWSLTQQRNFAIPRTYSIRFTVQLSASKSRNNSNFFSRQWTDARYRK